jgi:TonB-dependent starch-binding outer membrane protein SusC
MKITVLLLLIPFLQVSAKGYGQEKFSLNLEQVEAAKVFMNIQKKSEYRFFYLQDDIKKLGRININVTNATLPEIMQIVLGKALAYKIVSNYLVVISPNNAALENQIDVRGKIVDEAGSPLEGVTVKVKGQSNGVTTEADGSFSIVVDPKAILEISIVGYQAVEMPVNGRRLLDNIVLKVAASGLNEVVVVGYATQKRASLTGAVTTVQGKDIASIPTTSLSNTLAGRIPGATIINNSGFVGASSSIQIRGIGTLNSTAPLYVIDGVVRDKTAFDVLDPNEVESISILKDAASAAVYGARAGNGVIIVKTKGGTKQKPVFSYSGTLSTDRTTRPIQSYTALEELDYRKDQAETFGNPNPVTQQQLDYFKDKNFQLLDYVWKNPVSQQHDFSVNGGGDNITYYVMGGFNKANGSFKNTDYARYNFRSNVTAKINEYMKLNVNLSGNQRTLDRFYWPYDDQESVTVADFYRTTFNFSRLLPFYAMADGTPTTDTENGYPVAVGGWNPVELVLHGGYRNINYRTLNGIGRFDLKIPFVEGLSTSVQYNYTAGDRNAKALILFNRSYRFARPDVNNPYLLGDVNLNDVNIHNLSSTYESVNQGATFDKAYQLNWYLNYDRKFNKHTVSGLLVYERQKGIGNTFSGSAGDLLTTNVDQIFNASTDPTKRNFNGSEYHNARASWVGRLHYEYDDRYIAEFSFREDGSYIFPQDKRWGFFPSGSAAWRISKEKFFNVPFVNELKIRGSVGLLSTDNINPYQYQNVYNPSSSYILGDAVRNGIAAGTPPNPNITWEKSLTYNGGLDFALFNGKLTGDFDYFYRHTYDIFSQRIRVIPGTYGAALSSENYAEMSVKGFEFSLNYNGKAGEFSYSIGANMGYAKDKVLVLDEAAGLAKWRSAIGKPLNRIFGYVAEGIIRDQKDLDAIPSGYKQWERDPQVGTILYKDLRGADWENSAPNGKMDDFDQTYLSDNAVPRINYGITLGGTWKGISINALLQGVGAYDRVISTINGGGVFQTGDRPYFELWTERWTPTNTNAKYPRAGTWGMPEYGWGTSTFWMRNGAYMRLRNLNVAYELPRQWVNTFKAQSVRFYFNATNLFVISGITEMDPEQNTLDSYPIMKTFTGGVNITF